MLREAKLSALGVARRSGFAERVGASEWRRRRLLIVCYHGVSLDDEHEWSNLYVSADHLRRRFALLQASGAQVLPLGPALEMLAEGTLPSKSVALTFDDGTYDFYAKAYPLLEEFGYHATLYLTTYYCFDQRPVFDTVLSYLLWKGADSVVDLGPLLGGRFQIPLVAESRDERHMQIRTRANDGRISAAEKDNVAAGLARQVGVDYDVLRHKRMLHQMKPEEVARLDPKLVSVQLHTHRHRTPRSEDNFKRELADNRVAIAAMRPGADDLRHFCYPSGDHDPMFLPWLASAGVVSATTCAVGLAAPASNPLLLPRLLDSMRIPDLVFEGWVSGHAAWLPRSGQ